MAFRGLGFRVEVRGFTCSPNPYERVGRDPVGTGYNPENDGLMDPTQGLGLRVLLRYILASLSCPCAGYECNMPGRESLSLLYG